MVLRTLVLSIFCSIATVSAVGFTQSAAVKGSLICDDKPAINVLVKMFEHDTVTMDELMDSMETDSEGNFHLEGHADEVSSIEPKINIYHDCNDGLKPCQRKLTIYVPSSYVTKAKRASKVFDLGVIQLAGKYDGEERDCVH